MRRISRFSDKGEERRNAKNLIPKRLSIIACHIGRFSVFTLIPNGFPIIKIDHGLSRLPGLI